MLLPQDALRLGRELLPDSGVFTAKLQDDTTIIAIVSLRGAKCRWQSARPSQRRLAHVLCSASINASSPALKRRYLMTLMTMAPWSACDKKLSVFRDYGTEILQPSGALLSFH